MEWSDHGICIQLRRLGETKVCATFLTRNQGVHLGVVRLSRKQPLQVGMLCELTWKARLAEHMGTWTQVEIISNATVHTLNHVLKPLALSSAGELIAKLMPERQSHEALYEAYLHFLVNLSSEDWTDAYAELECQLLKDIGYGMDWTQCAVTRRSDDLAYVSPATGNAASRGAGEGYEEKLLAFPKSLADRLHVYAELFSRYYERHFTNAQLPFVRVSLQEELQRHRQRRA